MPLVYSLKASIGNARAIIYINASPENPAVIHRTILVKNKNEIPIKVFIEVDEKFEKFVDIFDKEITLEPNESKHARYDLTMDRGGRFEIKFNVGFSPADPNVKENSVGLLSTLIVNSKGPIIEDEFEEENPAEDTPFEQPINIETEETNKDTPLIQTDNPTVSVSVGGNKVRNKEESIAPLSPFFGIILGIIITIIIVAGGLGIFFIIKKLI